jgi:hypothetical protein
MLKCIYLCDLKLFNTKYMFGCIAIKRKEQAKITKKKIYIKFEIKISNPRKQLSEHFHFCKQFTHLKVFPVCKFIDHWVSSRIICKRFVSGSRVADVKLKTNKQKHSDPKWEGERSISFFVNFVIFVNFSLVLNRLCLFKLCYWKSWESQLSTLDWPINSLMLEQIQNSNSNHSVLPILPRHLDFLITTIVCFISIYMWYYLLLCILFL